jgi:hypothetical protein
MSMVFLSYSRKDRYFAELARFMLEKANIRVWVDRSTIRAGEQWRNAIDEGISGCRAVIVALSPHSLSSAYVTYEWASAMGKGKTIIPVILEHCELHPKLAEIQSLDFSQEHLPWPDLIERIREDAELSEDDPSGHIEAPEDAPAEVDPTVQAILDYLNRRGFQMVSFERIRQKIDKDLKDEQLTRLIEENRNVFRPATLKGGKPGMAKL